MTHIRITYSEIWYSKSKFSVSVLYNMYFISYFIFRSSPTLACTRVHRIPLEQTFLTVVYAFSNDSLQVL